MKKIALIITLTHLLFSAVHAQNKEPGNNIGKSLTRMKQEFPELRYINSDMKGDQYEDGYPEKGIGVFFYLKNNEVIEECMICQSNDGFSRMWFDTMSNTFVSNYSPGFGVSSYDTKHWCYSTFSLHLIYIEENGENTAMIIYEKGGWKTEVTGSDFSNKYK